MRVLLGRIRCCRNSFRRWDAGAAQGLKDFKAQPCRIVPQKREVSLCVQIRMQAPKHLQSFRVAPGAARDNVMSPVRNHKHRKSSLGEQQEEGLDGTLPRPQRARAAPRLGRQNTLLHSGDHSKENFRDKIPVGATA